MHKPHSNALVSYRDIEGRLLDKTPAVFVDYDGTLTPIVDRPELAVLQPRMRRTLDALARRCSVAIVSGRDRAEVEALVGLESVSYAGSHGFDIVGPRGLHLVHDAGAQAAPALDRTTEELGRVLGGIDGCLVERKQFAVAVHYRLVGQEDREVVFGTFERVASEHPELVTTSGKMVLELRPRVEWDKGAAVLWLLEALELDTPDVLPIFLGDDLTDEDAFRVTRERGVGILVAEETKPSHATYLLKNPEETRLLLERLIATLDHRP
jgi:alpha,alpha-trehalase